jgi:hypothetical protein
MIKPNMFKLVIEIIFISSSPFVLLIINFQKEWHTFDKEEGCFFLKNYPLLKFKCFEHAKKKLICVKA